MLLRGVKDIFKIVFISYSSPLLFFVFARVGVVFFLVMSRIVVTNMSQERPSTVHLPLLLKEISRKPRRIQGYGGTETTSRKGWLCVVPSFAAIFFLTPFLLHHFTYSCTSTHLRPSSRRHPHIFHVQFRTPQFPAESSGPSRNRYSSRPLFGPTVSSLRSPCQPSMARLSPAFGMG